MTEVEPSAWGTSLDIADVLTCVLSHPAAGWRARASAPAVCKTWRDTLGQGSSYDRMLCQRLREESRVYVPGERDCPHSDGWRALFLQLWPLRDMWASAESARPTAAEKEVRFNISVAVRFRPASKTRAAGGGGEQSVTLPLHQRVQLLKLKHGCTRREAMKMLAAETPGGAAAAAAKGSPLDEPEVMYTRLYSGTQDEAPTPPEGLYEKMEAERLERLVRKPWLEGRRDTGVTTTDPRIALRMGVRLEGAPPDKEGAGCAPPSFIESRFSSKVEYAAWLCTTSAPDTSAAPLLQKDSAAAEPASSASAKPRANAGSRVSKEPPGASSAASSAAAAESLHLDDKAVSTARIMSVDAAARQVVNHLGLTRDLICI